MRRFGRSNRKPAGEPFAREQKDRWNGLKGKLDEYTRRERLRELAGLPGHTEGERSFRYDRGDGDERLPKQTARHGVGVRKRL